MLQTDTTLNETSDCHHIWCDDSVEQPREQAKA